MPLRDHFRSPVNDTHSWDEVYGQWPGEIVRHLTTSCRLGSGPRRKSTSARLSRWMSAPTISTPALQTPRLIPATVVLLH